MAAAAAAVKLQIEEDVAKKKTPKMYAARQWLQRKEKWQKQNSVKCTNTHLHLFFSSFSMFIVHPDDDDG